MMPDMISYPSRDWSDLRYLVETDLNPIVTEIDQKGTYPESLLTRFGALGLYSAHVGPNGPASGGLFDAVQGMSVVGESCLSTAFMTWCQSTCAWYLYNSDNTTLKSDLLPYVAAGAQLGGTGLSNPMKSFAGIEANRLQGERVSGGYVVSGVLSWVSNLGDDHVFGALFTVPGKATTVMALVRCGQPGVTIDQRAHFCALEGTRTLAVSFRKAFISDDQILADPAEPYLVRVAPGFIILQAGMALGLIRGAIAAMKKANLTHGPINTYLPEQPDVFEEALEGLEAKVRALAATPYQNTPDYMVPLLQARLAAAEWSLRAANAAMLHAGTSGYLQNGTAQRRLREAYFIAIVTPSIKHLHKELHDIANGSGCMRHWKSCSALAG